MSTLSIAPSFARPAAGRAAAAGPAHPAHPDAPVRLTRRGRVVVVVAFLALALALMTAFGGWATATLHSGPPASVDVVTVTPGQTLYGIAGEIAEPGHVREMVLRIEQLNSLDSATLQPGQHLAVPRG